LLIEDAARRVEVPRQHVIRIEAQQSGARSIACARVRRTCLHDVCCTAIYDFWTMSASNRSRIGIRCGP